MTPFVVVVAALASACAPPNLIPSEVWQPLIIALSGLATALTAAIYAHLRRNGNGK